jgi:hypothetical protein
MIDVSLIITQGIKELESVAENIFKFIKSEFTRLSISKNTTNWLNIYIFQQAMP